MTPLLRALRPHQWTKNLLVLAAPAFALRLFEPEAAAETGVTVIAFCLASSATYLFNDLRDRERDRRHPVKRSRPIAAGEVSPAVAAATSAALGLASLSLVGVLVSRATVAVIGGYLLLQIAYTLVLKHLPVVDALTVAAGFVLRAVAGAVAIDVDVSQWLLICTTFFALFVSLAKRRNEVSMLRDQALEHRDSLASYDVDLLDQLVAVTAAATLMAYTLYTADPATAEKLGSPWMPVTIPFVIYALFRFLWLTHRDQEIGDPARALVRDPGLLTASGLWALAVLIILYLA